MERTPDGRAFLYEGNNTPRSRHSGSRPGSIAQRPERSPDKRETRVRSSLDPPPPWLVMRSGSQLDCPSSETGSTPVRAAAAAAVPLVRTVAWYATGRGSIPRDGSTHHRLSGRQLRPTKPAGQVRSLAVVPRAITRVLAGELAWGRERSYTPPTEGSIPSPGTR